MTSIKKAMAGAAVAAVAAITLASGAEAGHRHKFRHHFGFYGPVYGYHYDHRPYYKGCWHFKRKYYGTGSKYWLRKYKHCRYGW